DMEAAAQQISELQREVEALATLIESSSATLHQPTTIIQNRTRASRSQACYLKFQECWFHYKFGSQARRCLKPCDFKSRYKDRPQPASILRNCNTTSDANPPQMLQAKTRRRVHFAVPLIARPGTVSGGG
ncbi:hypothetical protein ABMA28_004200, partial [Loxostege sticticalis]